MGGGLSRKKQPWDKVISGPLDREMLIRDIFHKVDEKKSGSISMLEFRQLAAKQTKYSMDLQDAVFRRMDINHDDKLSMEEFVKFNLETGETAPDTQFVKQCGLWLRLASMKDIPTQLDGIVEDETETGGSASCPETPTAGEILAS